MVAWPGMGVVLGRGREKTRDNLDFEGRFVFNSAAATVPRCFRSILVNFGGKVTLVNSNIECTVESWTRLLLHTKQNAQSRHDRAQDRWALGGHNQVVRENAGWSRSPRAQGSLLLMLGVL